MIKGIQLLRAVAALSVVFFHCHFREIETGTFGVDIFFVISGFIIAYMVNQSTRQFMVKRIIRISPLYFLATFLTMALAFIRPQWFNHVIISTEALVKTILFIPYQIKGSGPILSSGWTLNNEMFFYVAMFLCIIIFKKKKYLVPACGGMLILLLIVLNSFNKDTITAYSHVLRFYRNGLLPEFIYGLALYYFWDYHRTHKTKTGDAIMIGAGLVAFALMIYFDLSNSLAGTPRNIRYGIPSLLFVNAFVVLEGWINEKNRIVKVWLKLGDASYAMYLFHPFVIYFLLRVVYPKIPVTRGLLLIDLSEVIFAMVSVALVSALIYELIDKPSNIFFKKLIKKYKGPRVTKVAVAEAERSIY
ncbi:acyltransferase [Mucilaginibacter sp. L3T2-6]|uniref:acyltransferase family protein n=1 Tax=Mucilaginibacter sp. L3T2-6 TaxID=3062491 RepID=UPI00267554B0|nr:acyltransferase [Mucilaginibacter sp. L3T2-6]MDO3644438.1 acyltransferase [Mucilaginibacter sp. L3T2-6]MDV6216890.1 acyltransferase [Mucilaginibacter sp. L3T2-6]